MDTTDSRGSRPRTPTYDPSTGNLRKSQLRKPHPCVISGLFKKKKGTLSSLFFYLYILTRYIQA